MSYISNASIELRLGASAYAQLTDDDGDGVADAAVVDEARLAAEGEVNSYLATRYAVPVSVAGNADLAALLASVALDLVEHRLRGRRPPVSESAERRRTSAIEWLTRVASGAIDLPATVPSAPSRGTIAVTTGNERVLSREEMAQF